MLNDEATQERLNAAFDKFKTQNPEINRETFDQISGMVLDLFSHRLSNVKQISDLNKELYQRQKKETEALKQELEALRTPSTY